MLNQDGANAQAYKLAPLLTLRVPVGSARNSGAVFRFQSAERETVTYGGYDYRYLECRTRMDAAPVGQVPYSPYWYQMIFDNSYRSGSIQLGDSRVDPELDGVGIRDFFAANDGLRNASLHMFIRSQVSRSLDRESVFLVHSSVIGFDSIALNLLAPMKNIVPPRVLL